MLFTCVFKLSKSHWMKETTYYYRGCTMKFVHSFRRHYILWSSMFYQWIQIFSSSDFFQWRYDSFSESIVHHRDKLSKEVEGGWVGWSDKRMGIGTHTLKYSLYITSSWQNEISSIIRVLENHPISFLFFFVQRIIFLYFICRHILINDEKQMNLFNIITRIIINFPSAYK
jgi:hypothetical protein